MSIAESQESNDAINTEAIQDSGERARVAFHRRKTFRATVVFALYIVSYSILSANGQYIGRPSGEIRWGFGLATTDLSRWCPAGMRWERRKSVSGEYIYDADPIGWFYLPLILADRNWVHPTGHYFDSESE